MNLDKTVCYCMHISNGKIKEAVDNGAVTVEDVMKITKAGTICGSCRNNLKVLVDYFVNEKSLQNRNL